MNNTVADVVMLKLNWKRYTYFSTGNYWTKNVDIF